MFCLITVKYFYLNRGDYVQHTTTYSKKDFIPLFDHFSSSLRLLQKSQDC